MAVKDLANDGVKFVTAAQGVPIGQYTMQMLDKAVTDPAYGADFKTRVEANIVSNEDNVRQVVSKVQLGEADAAVGTAPTPPPGARSAADHPGAGRAANIRDVSHRRRQGQQLRWRRSIRLVRARTDGQATLTRWGFLPPTQVAGTAQVTATAPIPAAASKTFAPDVAIQGLVGSPRSFTRDDLMKLPAETVQVRSWRVRARPMRRSRVPGCSTSSTPRGAPSCPLTSTTPSCG